MLDRRRLLACAGAAALGPRAGWAAAGGPAFLAAALHPDGAHRLHGLTAAGDSLFAVALPARGHAAAAHPSAPLAVAFARRPGRFALVIDCAEGREAARLSPPPARDFCGHGAFSADGRLVFTTENAHDLGEGRIGIWDGTDWRRLGEVPSGGVGPHEAILSTDGATLAVANGGILTHPDSGRAKLNLATMRPNVARLAAANGGLLDLAEAAPDLGRNSLRHLAAGPDGTIAVAAQWEGDPDLTPPLLALLRPGAGALDWLAAPSDRRAQGYAGSVAIAADGRSVACTAPKAGFAQVFDLASGAPGPTVLRTDAGGIAADGAGGFLLSDGGGALSRAPGAAEGPGEAPARPLAALAARWDNHLIRV